MQWALALLTICSVILCRGAMAQVERKLITYNAALQFSIPMKVQRRRNLLRGLKVFGADVACLQEVYDGSDIEWLRLRLRKTFPYSFSFTHQTVNMLNDNKEPPCNGQKITEFLTCTSNHCSGFNTSVHEDRIALLVCLQKQCARQAFSLSQDCLTCFFLRTDLTEAIDVCLNPNTTINVPGLVLFSKQKIINARAVEHHPGVVEIAKQGYLQVDIETIGTVVCTHLATPFLGDLYPEVALPYSNYVDQNRAEVDNLLTAVKGTETLVLAGDFNTGPSLPDMDICGYNPDSYRVLTNTEANLDHTILDNCTFCNDNTWNQQDCDWTIDHVFLRGHTLKGMKRIFDEPTVGKKYHVSDHYGVMATFVVDSKIITEDDEKREVLRPTATFIAHQPYK